MKGLDHVLKDDFPEDTESPDYKEFKKENSAALVLITGCLKPTEAHVYRGVETAKELMTKLDEIYMKNTGSSRRTLYTSLQYKNAGRG